LQTETIEILRAQVEQLDGHLKTKDDQIEKLQETLRDHTKLLEQTSKPGLWKRIFE
jgi:prefoldin subunit 5